MDKTTNKRKLDSDDESSASKRDCLSNNEGDLYHFNVQLTDQKDLDSVSAVNVTVWLSRDQAKIAKSDNYKRLTKPINKYLHACENEQNIEWGDEPTTQPTFSVAKTGFEKMESNVYRSGKCVDLMDVANITVTDYLHEDDEKEDDPVFTFSVNEDTLMCRSYFCKHCGSWTS